MPLLAGYPLGAAVLRWVNLADRAFCPSNLHTMDKISAILSPRAIVQIEKSRLSRWSALTKSLSFAPEIVFREIVTKLTKLLRRLFCVAVLHPSPLDPYLARTRWNSRGSNRGRLPQRQSTAGRVVRSMCQKPTFSGLPAKTLFHRSEFFFRARRAPLKKVEERGYPTGRRTTDHGHTHLVSTRCQLSGAKTLCFPVVSLPNHDTRFSRLMEKSFQQQFDSTDSQPNTAYDRAARLRLARRRASRTSSTGYTPPQRSNIWLIFARLSGEPACDFRSRSFPSSFSAQITRCICTTR